MQILLANPRGFCAGVDRAISIVENALTLYGAPIYVRHEVVHNRYVVDSLRKRGAIFIEQISEVPDGAILIFSAHGVSQAVRNEAKSRDLTVFDAIHCGKEHNRADLRLASVDKLAAREILNQVRAGYAKGGVRLQRKGLFLPLFQTEKLLLQPFRQRGVAEAKQRRFAVAAGGLGSGAVVQFQSEVHQYRAVALYGFRHANCSLV